jgi:outer membrane protein OmpU
MKKLLYGTTALLAVGAIANTAVAAEKIKLGLGGYWRGMAQFGDNDSDDNVDQGLRDHGFGQESEIYFSGSTTLPNGVKFGAAVQLEGETSGDQVDNTWIYASGGFGRIEYGETWGPGLLMQYGGVGEMNQTGDFASHNPFRSANGLGLNSFGGSAGINGLPSPKLAYYTPRFNGIQIGVAYVPEPKNASANGAQDNSADGEQGSEMIDAAVNYTGKMGAASVAAHFGYWTSETEPAAVGGVAAADVDGHSFGAQVGMNNFTIGGKYTKQNDIGGTGDDRVNIRFGAKYTMGQWGMGATFQKASQDVTGDASEDETSYLSAGVSYSMGPGISFGGGIVQVEQSNSDNAAASEADNTYAILWSKFDF